MAKQSFPMHLYAKEVLSFNDAPNEVRFSIFPFQDTALLGAYVGPVMVEAEIPDNFDLRSAMLATKQAELTKVRAEFTARITQLQREVNELQAIEMTA